MTQAPADRCKIPPGFWRAVESIGIRPAELVHRAQLPLNLPLSSDGILTTAQYFALMASLGELSDVPAVGLYLIEHADTSAHPPSTVAAFYARDLRDGMARLARFKRLCSAERLVLTEEQGSCVVTIDWLYSPGVEPDVSVDLTFATLVELARRGTGRWVVPCAIELSRASTGHGEHERYFGAPVRFNCLRNALIFDGADLDCPFPGHNAAMIALMTPALSSELQKLDRPVTVSEQVVTALKASLPSGRPDIGDVARQLGFSERTLQRRITDEGTSFKELLVEARQETCRRLLADIAVQIDEIAYLLGYQDTRSFYRAFKEWEGETPAMWRHRHMATAGNAEGWAQEPDEVGTV
ncbi:AraC family transcriptional regulator [Bradyrhizobium prioriisuperbiae]|uniref:AraC family transcriptional regulator n=1 Tax=Bradyrhizobium prioriisuperbiae TaxID=2854389 RepID=UPI0028E6AB61|nr:AraC family transcriptional regulator ligand-binding domain-containing protein [Bradyrhizobium prioritasuperba]